MTTIVPPELQSKIDYWRAAAASGTLTRDDVKDFTRALREGRFAAAAASAATKRKTAIREIPHADDLLGGL